MPPILTTGAGTFPVAAAPGGYTGPGDIVGSALGWWGLRGYNGAYATGSNPAVDLVDQAGNNPLTVNILSTGALNVAAISAWVTANSVSTIRLKKIYDQSGNGVHLSQAATGLMPAIVLAALGSLPIIDFSSASAMDLRSATNIVRARPYTYSAVYKHKSGLGGIMTSNGVDAGMVSDTNLCYIFGGSTFSASASDATYHAVQAILDGSAGLLYVDGTTVNGNSTRDMSATFTLGIFAGSYPSDNRLGEAGVWGSAFTGGNLSAMNSNQHSYWGF